jgi:hypothetical protein
MCTTGAAPGLPYLIALLIRFEKAAVSEYYELEEQEEGSESILAPPSVVPDGTVRKSEIAFFAGELTV